MENKLFKNIKYMYIALKAKMKILISMVKMPSLRHILTVQTPVHYMPLFTSLFFTWLKSRLNSTKYDI
jgi:hypothetical protein